MRDIMTGVGDFLKRQVGAALGRYGYSVYQPERSYQGLLTPHNNPELHQGLFADCYDASFEVFPTYTPPFAKQFGVRYRNYFIFKFLEVVRSLSSNKR